MHSTSVLLVALFALLAAAFAAETSEQGPSFAFLDRPRNDGKFAFNRFARSSGSEKDAKFAFAFAKRSVPQEDAVEQVVERFARRFAREVMQTANERGFAFA